MRSDLRYAIRSLSRSPGLTAAIVVTLALGLAASTAIFSVVNAVLLRPLPYAQPERVVQIVENVPAEESPSGIAMRMSAMSTDDLLWWQENSQTLSHWAMSISDYRTFAAADGTVRLSGALVSPALFATHGMLPVLGRGLEPDDERADASVVVLGESMWRRYFASDASVLGRAITLEGRSYTIVGVMPAEFGREAYWLPFVATASTPGQFRLLPVTALVRDGVSLEAASAEINALGAQLRGVEPESGAAPRFELVRELDQLTAGVAPALRVLVVSVAAVLLIVCANVANLLLVRGTKRHEEIAVRRALGATRGRIARQVLTESLLLSIIASAIGVALAYGAVALLKALAAVELSERFATTLGGEILPRLDDIAIDPAALGFIVVTSLATAALFGSLPGWRLARIGEAAPRGAAGTGKTVVGQVLATAQLALAMILLIGAGLLLKSFVKLTAVDAGFEPRSALSFELVIPGDYTPERRLQTAEDLAARMATHSQVEAIGFTDVPPLTAGMLLGGGLLPTGASADEVRADFDLPMQQRNQQRFADAGYLRALGARLVIGRGFDDEDPTRPGLAALVSRAYAQHYFPSVSPIGATIGSSYGTLTIVGVVNDVRLRGLDSEPERTVFIEPRQALTAIRASASPAWRSPEADRMFLTLGSGSVAFVVRTTGDPLAVIADLRNAANEIAPELAIDRALPMEDVVSGTTTRPRFYATLISVFGAVAALIAVVGIYGVLAYVVSQRTREIGIRMALGAQRGTVLKLVLGRGVAMIAIGSMLGLAGAVALTRFLDGMLFGLSPLDVATYVVVAVGFASAAMLASYLPARRATSIDPLVALRHQ
jgi:predicted permease